jgi:hypothetical protein
LVLNRNTRQLRSLVVVLARVAHMSRERVAALNGLYNLFDVAATVTTLEVQSRMIAAFDFLLVGALLA